MSRIVKASTIKSETIKEATVEILKKYTTTCILVAADLGCGVTDAGEAIATHIIITDTDYIL